MSLIKLNLKTMFYVQEIRPKFKHVEHVIEAKLKYTTINKLRVMNAPLKGKSTTATNKNIPACFLIFR